MTYSWLVENFTKDGKSTGLYMACQVNMTVTAMLGAEVEDAIHCASKARSMGARLPRAE